MLSRCRIVAFHGLRRMPELAMTANSSSSWKLTSLSSKVILTCVVAVVCYQADRLVNLLGIPPDHTASFWPATPFLVGILLLAPRKLWAVLIIAGLGAMALGDFENGVPFRHEVWITLGNLTEVLIATVGLIYVLKGVPHLCSLKTLAKYSVVAIILPPMVSSLVGAFGSYHIGYGLQWRVWFFADALAFLTVTPALLSWVRDGRAWAREFRNYVELAALVTSLVLFGYFAFSRTGSSDSPALLYSLVPLLLWSALRLGLKGVSSSMLVVIFMSTWGAAHDRGPFTGLGPLQNVLSLQLFLVFAAIPFMVLAVLVEEEKQAQQELADQHAQLTEAQRLAQVGSWHWEPSTDKVTWSEELYRISGRDPDLPAPSFKEHETLYTPESWQRLQRVVEEALRTGESYELDLEMINPDGTTRWLLARGEALQVDGGRILYLRGTVKDITERKRAEETLAGLSHKLIEAQEQERIRIARDLHDDIGQRLALVSVGLNQTRESLPEVAVELRNQMDVLRNRILEISTDVQVLSRELHSSKLELLGVVAAMNGFCKEFSDKHKVEIGFVHEGIPPAVPPEISISLYRVLQESLQNALKHSGVRSFEVKLQGSPSEIRLTIGDSGAGFDTGLTTRTQGLGLISMRERVNMVKGTFSVTSRPQSGTKVSVWVPLPAGARAEEARGARA
jgi:signal transduction histidine kinase